MLEQLGKDFPIRDDLRGKTVYGAPQRQDVIMLNVNENPYNPPEVFFQELDFRIKKSQQFFNRYPDKNMTSLRKTIAQYFSSLSGVLENCAHFDENYVWPANGSNEILQQLFLLFGGSGRTALSIEPTYAMYTILSEMTGTRFMQVPLSDSFDMDTESVVSTIRKERPSLFLLANPNNPTGTFVKKADLRAIVDTCQRYNCIFVLDEAYAEFSSQHTAFDLLTEYPKNMVIVRTMSKAFAFAGVRIGYLVANPALISAIQLVRLPYNMSLLTQICGEVAFSHAKTLLSTVDHLILERDRMINAVRKCGLTALSSETNFFLFGIFAQPETVFQEFLDAGILIRNLNLKGYLRVSVGLDHENDQFLSICRRVLQQLQ